MSGPTDKAPRVVVETDTSTGGTLVSRTSPPVPTHRSEVTPPTAIGRYRVERLLGQGGMGRVWLARDTILGRNVAIKVLRDDLQLPPSVHDELVVHRRRKL